MFITFEVIKIYEPDKIKKKKKAVSYNFYSKLFFFRPIVYLIKIAKC